MSVIQTLRVLLPAAMLAACTSAPPAPKPPPAVEPTPAPVAEPEPAPPALAEPEPTPEPDPETKARAVASFENGQELFRQGRYEQAELELKEALNLYPFMADANLVLGKVLLIRGAAARDQVMIDSARLMFKMALSIDPELREAEVLLNLFNEGSAPAAGETVTETSARPQ